MVVTLAATVAAIVGLAVVLWHHWDEVGRAIETVSLVSFLAITALQVVAYLMRTQAFGMCVRAAGAHTPTGALHGASASTFLANTVVPMYVGGLVRVAMLRRLAGKEGPTVGQMVTADGVSLFLEAVITVALIVVACTQLDVAWWWPVALGAVCVAAGWGVWQARRRLAHREWVKALNVFDDRMKLVVLTVLLAAVIGVQPIRFYVVLHAVGVDVSMLEAVLAFVITSAGAILPVGPGPASVGGVAAVLGHEGLAEAAASGVVLAASAVLAAAVYTGVALGVLAWQRRRGRVAAEAVG